MEKNQGKMIQKFNNKRVIITGGFGVIGREMIKILAKNGAEVLCYDRISWPDDLEYLRGSIEYYKGDITVSGLPNAIDFDPHYLFHLAASFERSIENKAFWETNFCDNMMLSHNVASVACRMHSLKKFVFASSYLIYDTAKYLVDKGAQSRIYLAENDRVTPRNLCGAAKYYTENELVFLVKQGVISEAVAARIFRVYGKGSNDVISRWIRAALSNEPISVYGRLNSFDYIYAQDVAEGLLRLGIEPKASGVVNLGTGVSTEIDQVVDTLKHFIPDLSIQEITEEESLVERSAADLSKLIEAVKWHPSTGLKDGTAQIVAYEQNCSSVGQH
jgi:nucleoside-diphosphate-sugar epimerase